MRTPASIRVTLTIMAAAAALAACDDSPAEPAPTPSFTQGAAVINGGGTASLTDPDGATYDARVSIAAKLNASGAASGAVNIVFGQAFSAAWGAVPGVHTIHVWGTVETVTAGAGDDIVLTGTATEVDIIPGGERLVFPNEPFQLVVTGPNTFTFTWCLLPTFDFQVTAGALSFGRPLPAIAATPRMTADLSGVGCPRGG